jgi:glycosyltransferase involved in cell wall biosynthesis
MVLVIDDGTDAENAALINAACSEFDFADLHVKDRNSGKGGAVITGMLLASSSGFSHDVQIDADGQHNIDDAHLLISKSEQNPKTLICGRPIYDESIPKHRYYARYLTHVWVWIETLSFSIPDSMCGFRVYPLSACKTLLNNTRVGKYIDFDGEFIVRLYW